MNRRHGFVLSLAIALIAVVGVFAAARTAGLGSRARAANDAQIAQRARALDRYAASLQKALAQSRTPREAGVTTSATAPLRVVYHRPPPIVVHVKRSGESEGHEGGELDD